VTTSNLNTMTDTSRDELRSRIGAARTGFDRLIRAADPQAQPAASEWTVQQVTAHVLTAAYRYREFAEGRTFRVAATPRDLDAINAAELQAALAPIPEMADRLLELAPVMDQFFDRVHDEPLAFPFHGGVKVPGISAQTNWLGELLLHGEDIARACGRPWELQERDLLLVLSGVMAMAPGYLRRDLPSGTELLVALRVPGARPWVMHIHDGVAEVRERRPKDRADAVLRVPASTLTKLLYQRVGPVQAVRHGLLVTGGRRPWRSLRLQSMFEAP
jgi:uncharacterized protein (TIGR03083 family)